MVKKETSCQVSFTLLDRRFSVNIYLLEHVSRRNLPSIMLETDGFVSMYSTIILQGKIIVGTYLQMA